MRQFATIIFRATMLAICCENSIKCRNNVASLCCAKNCRCESFPLKWTLVNFIGIQKYIEFERPGERSPE